MKIVEKEMICRIMRTGERGGETVGVESETRKDQREEDREDGGRGRWGSPGGHTMCERARGLPLPIG